MMFQLLCDFMVDRDAIPGISGKRRRALSIAEFRSIALETPRIVSTKTKQGDFQNEIQLMCKTGESHSIEFKNK
jgi:hypothetical protein